MRILLSAVLIALAQPALAQSANPDSGAVAAAEAFLISTGFEQQLEQSSQKGAEATFETITSEAEKREGRAMPAELKARVKSIMMENMRANVARMKPTALRDAAIIYARYFTAAELAELQRLQTAPVMVKAQRVAPTMMIELMQIGVRSAAQGMPELRAKLTAAIQDWARTQKKR